MPDLDLEVVEGPNAGHRASLAAPVVIGRAPDVNLLLDDPQVSRHHARVTPQPDGSALVEDLGSSNGTFINHSELHAPARLDVGDDLLIGVTVLELRDAAAVARQTSAVRPVPPALAAAQRRPTFVDPVAEPDLATPELDRLLDARTKLQARTAPLAILVLVALVVAIYLGAR
jgi:pSer/pThr/pTyr-binding forkhead associated (FHA) protein